MHNLETITLFFRQLRSKLVYSSQDLLVSNEQSTSQGHREGSIPEVSFCAYSDRTCSYYSLYKLFELI